MINRDRLTNTFLELVKIDSESGYEKEILEKMIELVEPIHPEIIIDDQNCSHFSNTGNLILKIEGENNKKPLLFSGHLDTVKPGKNIEPVIEDGVIKSKGQTILASDDKSALAILIEVLYVIKEKGIVHCPLEIVLTVCEEVGLLGSFNLNYSLLESKAGYVLDMKAIDGIVKKAPSAIKFEAKITGKEAHAGAEPEKGVNAIKVMADVISRLPMGRIDDETTCNIGTIKGGLATNIVPGSVEIKGAARSLDDEKLNKIEDRIKHVFETVINEYRVNSPDKELPRIDFSIKADYQSLTIPEDHPIIQNAIKAASLAGIKMSAIDIGGGSDANVFINNGITTSVIGTGMDKVHTVNEQIKVDDMVKCAEIVLELIKLHS